MDAGSWVSLIGLIVIGLCCVVLPVAWYFVKMLNWPWLCSLGLHRWELVQNYEYGDVMPCGRFFDDGGLRYISRAYSGWRCGRCGKTKALSDLRWDPHTGVELPSPQEEKE